MSQQKVHAMAFNELQIAKDQDYPWNKFNLCDQKQLIYRGILLPIDFLINSYKVEWKYTKLTKTIKYTAVLDTWR